MTSLPWRATSHQPTPGITLAATAAKLEKVFENRLPKPLPATARTRMHGQHITRICWAKGTRPCTRLQTWPDLAKTQKCGNQTTAPPPHLRPTSPLSSNSKFAGAGPTTPCHTTNIGGRRMRVTQKALPHQEFQTPYMHSCSRVGHSRARW